MFYDVTPDIVYFIKPVDALQGLLLKLCEQCDQTLKKGKTFTLRADLTSVGSLFLLKAVKYRFTMFGPFLSCCSEANH